MNTNGPIYVAGHGGLVGSAIMRRLQGQGRADILTRGRDELDLRDQRAVHEFIRREAPRCIFVAAARVGGILDNSRRQADFLYENLAIAANVIHAAAEHGVEKLLFLGSSCVFPREAPQPITEEALLTGPLEPTNEGYAIAKIAGLKLCEHYAKQYGKRFISAMPTNVYGPGDNFHPVDSHVIAGMMRRFHEAVVAGLDEVTVWGSGRPRREFLHVDDLAEALVLLMDVYEETRFINVGTGEDRTIAELAVMIAEVAGFEGRIVFDTSKPDGTPRKLLDVSRIHALGWHARIPLHDGLRSTYEWAVANRIFES
ncbi:MAG TPA: GDP-L-fucose synthase [Thermoanaerobaculia bacterium]|jgi:GDP-L-fucose synthase|nr:GDP-L-fucose synthase [Thermoanaerobaculia bacterium]